MPYLVDGHNVIAQMPDIELDDPNDEAKLVLLLRGYCARTGKKVVVVFDHGLPGGKSHLSTSSVEVVFAAAHHTNADTLIRQRIGKVQNSQHWVVVSDDYEVQQDAKYSGARIITTAEFTQLLQTPTPPKRDTASNPQISTQEVDEWLELFDDS